MPAAERRVFHPYADEFRSFATDSFALILSEARKYGLTLTVAHQYLEQLPDKLWAAVFGNVGSMLACRIGASDAAIIAEQIGLGDSDALLDLPNHTAWAQLLSGGVPTSPLRLNLHSAPRPRRADATRLVLQPGLGGSSSFPVALAGSLLVAAAPARPGARGFAIRRPGPDRMPEQAAHFGYGERQQIGVEVDHALFPRPRHSGARRDRHAPASPA